jgi:hypothetical protein
MPVKQYLQVIEVLFVGVVHLGALDQVADLIVDCVMVSHTRQTIYPQPPTLFVVPFEVITCICPGPTIEDRR